MPRVATDDASSVVSGLELGADAVEGLADELLGRALDHARADRGEGTRDDHVGDPVEHRHVARRRLGEAHRGRGIDRVARRLAVGLEHRPVGRLLLDQLHVHVEARRDEADAHLRPGLEVGVVHDRDGLHAGSAAAHLLGVDEEVPDALPGGPDLGRVREVHRGLPAAESVAGCRRAASVSGAQPGVSGSQPGGRVAHEASAAAQAAEGVDAAVVLCQVARVGSVDGHAADRVEEHHLVGPDGRRGRVCVGGPYRLLGGQRGRSGCRHEGGATAPDLDQLGQDRQGDLRGGLRPQVEARRRPQRGEALLGHTALAQEAAHHLCARGRGHQPDVGHLARQRRLQRLLVPLPLRGDHDVWIRGRRQARHVRRGNHLHGIREGLRVCDGVDHRDREACRGTQLDERRHDRRRAHDPQEGRRQHGLHGDLQRAAGVAGHDDLHDTVPAAGVGGRILRDAQQARLAVGQGSQRLADDDRLRATAADPALDAAVGVDDAVRPRPGRGGPPHGHDRGHDEGPPRGRELRRPTIDAGLAAGPLAAGALAVYPCVGRAYDATPFSLRMAQILGGVMGMSMLRTPRCHRASTTALAMAGGAPTVADSPTPFAPSGWWGEGVMVLSVSQAGVSTAVGSR